jgi:hypothetical protein
MFGNKPPKQPSQMQKMSDVTLNSGVVQQFQAGRDLQSPASLISEQATQQEIATTEVIKQLEYLEIAVKASALTQKQKFELLNYLRPAKNEASKKGGSKEFVGQNLKQVNETLKTLNETTEAGKTLWKTGMSALRTIAIWAGLVI